MIEPPTKPVGQPERKVELDQAVDFAIQLLVEEANLVGWQRVEFLTAVLDAANARLSVIEGECQLEDDIDPAPATDHALDAEQALPIQPTDTEL